MRRPQSSSSGRSGHIACRLSSPLELVPSLTSSLRGSASLCRICEADTKNRSSRGYSSLSPFLSNWVTPRPTKRPSDGAASSAFYDKRNFELWRPFYDQQLLLDGGPDREWERDGFIKGNAQKGEREGGGTLRNRYCSHVPRQPPRRYCQLPSALIGRNTTWNPTLFGPQQGQLVTWNCRKVIF